MNINCIQTLSIETTTISKIININIEIHNCSKHKNIIDHNCWQIIHPNVRHQFNQPTLILLLINQSPKVKMQTVTKNKISTSSLHLICIHPHLVIRLIKHFNFYAFFIPFFFIPLHIYIFFFSSLYYIPSFLNFIEIKFFFSRKVLRDRLKRTQKSNH